jgi:hypothetical protein
MGSLYINDKGIGKLFNNVGPNPITGGEMVAVEKQKIQGKAE